MGKHLNGNREKVKLGIIMATIIGLIILMATLIVNLFSDDTDLAQQYTQEERTTGDISDEYEKASTEIGKTVEEAKNEQASNNVAKSNTNSTTTTENNTANNTVKNTTNTSTNLAKDNNTTEKNEEVEVKFIAPIKGDIVREFATESLVYSETLEEWVTHNGIDIKADKTSVVTVAARGTVYAIKNDPRYGLTVIVNHEGGYQTVYANLLTAEYVVEGEEIEAGQTIGTIGNSATFEIADDYHLHFELIKDNEYINPTTCMDF